MDEGSSHSYNTDLVSGSLEDDNDILEVDFLQRLDSEDISELRKYFFSDLQNGPEKKRTSDSTFNEPNRGRPLNKTDFVKAIDKVTGSTALSLSASKLFQCLDCSDQGVVWWEEVLDHIINRIDLRGDATWRPVDSRVVLQNVPHCRKETIVKIVSIETETSFCYAVLSKFGRIGVYDGVFRLHDSYNLQLSSDDAADVGPDGENRRRVTTTWLIDGVHLPDADALLLVTSDRAIHLFDASGLVHVPLCHVSGLTEVPTCLAYTTSHGNNPSMLFIGDDQGNVVTMRFLQPKLSLFRKKHPDKLDKYYWKELESQGEWVTASVDVAVHSDAVRQIAYFPDNETVVTCSQDPLTTLVVRHVTGRRSPYIFKLSRGVRCFHMERTLKLLATGSSDCVVRLWNPVVTKQPTVSLFGHKNAVVDVLILRHLSTVLSCSNDGVVKVWDIDDQCCIQTLALNFPSFSVLGKRIEFGTRSIYPGPSTGKPAASSVSEKEAPPPSCSVETPSTSVLHTEDIRDYQSTTGENVWSRGNLLLVCCNHVAMLQLNESGALRRGEDSPPPLPPPSREHRACVPSPWGAVEVTISSDTHTPRNLTSSPSEISSQISSSVDHLDREYRPPDVKDLTVHLLPPLETDTYEDLPLSARDNKLLEEKHLPPGQGLNVRRVHHDQQLHAAKAFVEQCAPHLALKLWDVEHITFSRPLPVTSRMRHRGIDVSDPETLTVGRMHRDSVSGSLSQSGSARSSSDTISGRSTRSRCGKLLTPEGNKLNKKSY